MVNDVKDARMTMLRNAWFGRVQGKEVEKFQYYLVSIECGIGTYLLATHPSMWPLEK
jgi:hypothetical protein